MIDGVPDEVDEGILESLENALVDLDIAASRCQLRLLAEIPGEIPHDLRESLEQRAAREHEDRPRAFEEVSHEPLRRVPVRRERPFERSRSLPQFLKAIPAAVEKARDGRGKSPPGAGLV